MKVKKSTKKGPKIVQKFTKVDQHSHRMTRDAGDGHDGGAQRKVSKKKTSPTNLNPAVLWPWGGIKGGVNPSLWDIGKYMLHV